MTASSENSMQVVQDVVFNISTHFGLLQMVRSSMYTANKKGDKTLLCHCLTPFRMSKMSERLTHTLKTTKLACISGQQQSQINQNIAFYEFSEQDIIVNSVECFACIKKTYKHISAMITIKT